MDKDKQPTNRKEIFAIIEKLVLDKEWFEMPHEPRYNGTGGPGNFLEDKIGAVAGNKDIPDIQGWELKWYTPKTNLVTLFHKTPKPKDIMRKVVKNYGQKDEQGRLGFRHTIRGKSADFKTYDDGERLFICPLKSRKGVEKIKPYWSHQQLMASAGTKLNRLIMVRGEKNDRSIRFTRAEAYETFHLPDLISEIMSGTIAIDFDAREKEPGSDALRDHGTKFRIPYDEICRLYLKKERIGI